MTSSTADPGSPAAAVISAAGAAGGYDCIGGLHNFMLCATWADCVMSPCFLFLFLCCWFLFCLLRRCRRKTFSIGSDTGGFESSAPTMCKYKSGHDYVSAAGVTGYAYSSGVGAGTNLHQVERRCLNFCTQAYTVGLYVFFPPPCFYFPSTNFPDPNHLFFLCVFVVLPEYPIFGDPFICCPRWISLALWDFV